MKLLFTQTQVFAKYGDQELDIKYAMGFRLLPTICLSFDAQSINSDIILNHSVSFKMRTIRQKFSNQIRLGFTNDSNVNGTKACTNGMENLKFLWEA